MGWGICAALEHLRCPLYGHFAPKWRFVISRKGYFIKFELFSSPEGRNLTKKLQKNSTAATMPPPPSV